MAEFYDITDWTFRNWETTLKGTRPQNIVEDPTTSEIYYFKQSKLEYQPEIWSEIIASKFGKLVGINTLDYNVALHEKTVGCLSKSMIDNNSAMLYHGVDILNDFLPKFSITDKPTVSFQQIETICSLGVFDTFLSKFIEMIIFDSIIGNTDRHTENWAFIVNIASKFKEHKVEPKYDLWGSITHFFKKPLNPVQKSKTTNSLSSETTDAKYSFSPIYDNGSCLAREKTEIEVCNLLKDKIRLGSYLNRGKHEIRWNGQKLNFFDLCKKIQDRHKDTVKDVTERILSKATGEAIAKLVHEIDKNIVDKIEDTHLTEERKDLIVMLIVVRLQRLKDTLRID